MWWQCEKGHEWVECVYKIVKGKPCPFCANKRVLVGYNDLKTLYPTIAAEWDYEKNKGIDINSIVPGSTKKVWWKCSTCGNEWESKISNCTRRGTGCLKCGKIIAAQHKHETALAESGCITDELLISEWNYEKNEGKKPSDYTVASNQSVWWRCSKCNYEWESKVGNRTILKRGCPCCANRVVVPGVNDLATKRPDLATQWHKTKNGDLTPQQVTVGSGKKYGGNVPKDMSTKPAFSIGVREPTALFAIQEG